MKRRVLVLAPHPDDESITGLLALRLRQECGFEVWVAPVTLGSCPTRRAARLRELRAACRVLGFRCRMPMRRGEDSASLRQLRTVLEKIRPVVVVLPHARDGHPTHRAVHRLGLAALDAVRFAAMPVVETEYWHPLARPNLMVAARREHLKMLRRALACHKGEILRNDYAARLPAWMSDNVRRGAERIGGKGAAAPKIAYATLYRTRMRVRGKWKAAFRGGRIIVTPDELQSLAAIWNAASGNQA